jgi:RimJ/RimL family protein N-acetyltransferase
VLGEPEARDRVAFIELLASPEVGTYLGGPQPRDELERAIPQTPSRRPGLFVVDLDGAMIGQVILGRATGHAPAAAAGQAELGYLFRPGAWGCGYAAEACAAALGWLAGALPGEPVVLFTQTANARSMRFAAKLGFTEVERYEAYLLEAAFLKVAGVGGQQELPDAGIIGPAWHDGGVAGTGAEVRRVQVGQGRRSSPAGTEPTGVTSRC